MKQRPLFIDDQRDPPNDGKDWKVIRSFEAFVDYYSEPGYSKDDHIFASYMSFDHDLGEDKKTGHDIVKWMIMMDQNGMLKIPQDFTFTVHSQNPVGRDNIANLIQCYMDFKEEYER